MERNFVLKMMDFVYINDGFWIQKVHQKWKSMRDSGYKPRDSRGDLFHTEWDEKASNGIGAGSGAWVPSALQDGDAPARQAAMAVIDLFDSVRALHVTRLKKKKLDRLSTFGKCQVEQLLLRLPLAVAICI